MHDKDKKFLVCLSQIPGVGGMTIGLLLSRYHDPEAVWQLEARQIEADGFPTAVIEGWKTKGQIDPEAEWEKICKFETRVVTLDEPEYPDLLKQIYNPPQVLFMRGNLARLPDLALAVVGTRRATSYGRQVVKELMPSLTQAGLLIVSGLALGIDAEAHAQALSAGGQTVAVLASGVDQIYPRTNQRLAEQILENGLLISEFALGVSPQAMHFPIRNRIVSGLCLGTLVVEAAKSSGALITANFALEQNREVFAVPGGIFANQSQGTNQLIKQGARLVLTADDILEELHLEKVHQQSQARAVLPASLAEEQILALLADEPLHIDRLAALAQLPAGQMSAHLTTMEIKGLVRNLGNNLFGRQ